MGNQVIGHMHGSNILRRPPCSNGKAQRRINCRVYVCANSDCSGLVQSLHPIDTVRLGMATDKKRKNRKSANSAGAAEVEASPAIAQPSTNGVAQTNGHLAAAVPSGGRPYTVSIAVPGSVIDNTQTMELATAVAGQIARTAAIFNIDEVIVIDDSPAGEPGSVGAGAAFLARVLQFMETPQYLRKALIPMHPDLRLSGTLPPMDAPHHMRATEWSWFREGVVTKSVLGEGSLLNIGLDKEAYVPQALQHNTRVTLQMGAQPNEFTLQQPGLGSGQQVLFGQLAEASSPRQQQGTYWGYTTRLASTLSQVFTECPYQGGYDLKVGTSERGTVVLGPELVKFPAFQHLLIGFGGPQGLEQCVQQDPALQAMHEDPMPEKLFNLYCNTCPRQGSRTIRTEEAILISLSYFQSAIGKHAGVPTSVAV